MDSETTFNSPQYRINKNGKKNISMFPGVVSLAMIAIYMSPTASGSHSLFKWGERIKMYILKDWIN